MSDKPRIVQVNLRERSYQIEIGHGNLAQTGWFLSERAEISHAVLVTDANVEEPHGHTVAESLAEAGAAVDVLVLQPGEATKSVETADHIYNEMLALGADRGTIVVAVGGGVIGDLAGFVASTYTRGLRFVQAPTTLLAQVDSSVGGKVGVNLPGAKNMVGAFWQPLGVLIDVDVLETLPVREYRSGLAEVVKYGVILDADFFSYLEANAAALARRDRDVLIEVIARCCRLKADVVEADELDEKGTRAALNYGHTFCHALEAITGYGTLLHGEAVAIGMLCASRLAERLGRIDASTTSRQRELLAALDLQTEVPDVDHDELVDLMAHDKKVQHGRLQFVLPSKMGAVSLVGDVNREDVLAALLHG